MEYHKKRMKIHPYSDLSPQNAFALGMEFFFLHRYVIEKRLEISVNGYEGLNIYHWTDPVSR